MKMMMMNMMKIMLYLIQNVEESYEEEDVNENFSGNNDEGVTSLPIQQIPTGGPQTG